MGIVFEGIVGLLYEGEVGVFGISGVIGRVLGLGDELVAEFEDEVEDVVDDVYDRRRFFR